jgi:hypothetical protein
VFENFFVVIPLLRHEISENLIFGKMTEKIKNKIRGEENHWETVKE